MKSCRVLLFIFMVSIVYVSSATHILGGFIMYKRTNLSAFTYEITYIAIRESDHGEIAYGTFSFGDGTTENQNYDVEKQAIDEHYDLLQVTVMHTFSAPGVYHLGYTESFRTSSIINLGDENANFYIESMLVIDPFVGMNQSPIFDSLYMSNGKTADKFLYSLDISDPDGDSLSYELVTPMIGPDQVLETYQYPHHHSYYTNYIIGNEQRDGMAQLVIDQNGTLIWDAPGDRHQNPTEQYLVNVRIREWRKVGQDWVNIGFITKEIIIDIETEEVAVEPLRTNNPSKILVYPNPSRGDIKIRVNSLNFSQIKILSLDGKLIFNQSINPLSNDDITLSLDKKVDPGIYLIQIFDEEERLLTSEKLVISQ